MIPRTSNQGVTNTQNLASFITQGDDPSPRQSHSSSIKNAFQIKFQIEKTLKEIKNKESQLKEIEDMIIEEQIQGKIKKIDFDRILVETDEDLKQKKAMIDDSEGYGLLNPLKQGILTSLLDKRREVKV